MRCLLLYTIKCIIKLKIIIHINKLHVEKEKHKVFHIIDSTIIQIIVNIHINY